jgi:formylglycine-generating enzyme required for sulfatase activity
MAGNVFEWTQDSAKPEGVCALKGGAWNYDYINTRCAYRLLVSPANRTSYIGFRIAIGLPIEGGSTHE